MEITVGNHKQLSPISSLDSSNSQWSERKMVISGCILFCLQSLLYSIPPLSLQYIYPLTFIAFTPICLSFSIIYKIGVRRCCLISLLFECLFCFLSLFIPSFCNMFGSNNERNMAHSICFGLLMGLISICSALIQLPIATIIVKTAPKSSICRVLTLLCVFSLIGLLLGPSLISVLLLETHSSSLFLIVSMLLLFCFVLSLIVHYSLPTNGNRLSPSNNALEYMAVMIKNRNILFSGMTFTFALICLTSLFPIFRVNWTYLGVSFTLTVPFANINAYLLVGSVKTMLIGLFGMSISLFYISHPIIAQNGNIAALTILGISSAFTLSPVMQYFVNNMTPNREYDRDCYFCIFVIYSVCFYVGCAIGPILGESCGNDLKVYANVLCVFALCIALCGALSLQYLQWKWVRVLNVKQVHYTPLLSDDRRCCKYLSCYIACGLPNKRNSRKKRKKRKKRKNEKIKNEKSLENAKRKKSRKSIDEIQAQSPKYQNNRKKSTKVSLAGAAHGNGETPLTASLTPFANYDDLSPKSRKSSLFTRNKSFECDDSESDVGLQRNKIVINKYKQPLIVRKDSNYGSDDTNYESDRNRIAGSLSNFAKSWKKRMLSRETSAQSIGTSERSRTFILISDTDFDDDDDDDSDCDSQNDSEEDDACWEFQD